MQISISSWSFRYFFQKDNFDLLDFVSKVQDLGADSFEIHPSYIDHDNYFTHLQKTVEKAALLGLDISSLIVNNDFALSGVQKRAEQVKNMERAIKAAGEMDIKRLNVFTGYHQKGQDPVMEMLRIRDCYREIVPLAEEKDILLCLENHSTVNNDADGLLVLIDKIGSDILKTNPDPTNFCRHHTQVDARAREIIYTETEKIAPLMANAHLKINTFDEEGKPEYADVPRLLKIFKKHDYEGDIVLEYFGKGNPEPAIKKGIKYLKSII